MGRRAITGALRDQMEYDGVRSVGCVAKWTERVQAVCSVDLGMAEACDWDRPDGGIELSETKRMFCAKF